MGVIELLHKIGELKKIKRTGWVRHGVKDAESVADHVFRVIFNTLIVGHGKKSLDQEKILKMSILHEIGEAITGDLVWSRGSKVDPKAKEEKERKEREAVKKLLSEVEDGDELYAIWIEFEDNKTPEAQFVKQMDKLETAMQAVEYEEENGREFSEWVENSKRYMKDPDIVKIFNKMTSKRKWK